MAVEERRERPTFDLLLISASVAGLNSQKWRDPDCFYRLL